ncbi:MAG: LamG-like jellyroll fold domain-containing protein [bacterium]
MKNNIKNNSGFTLLEFVTALVIVMILTGLATVSLNAFRVKNRDIKRVTDIQDIQGSLEVYYRDYQLYPTMITFGSIWAEGAKTYMEVLPTNPSPRNDGDCPDIGYEYSPDNDNASYHIAFCISNSVADLDPGINSASPEGELGSGVAGDYDTKLLLHLNNNAVDTSPNNKTVTNSNTTFSTTKKFGTHSGSFNGTSSYLTVPDSDDWDFNVDDFTIDFWFNSTDFTGNNSPISQFESIGNYWDLYFDAINGWTFDVYNLTVAVVTFNQGGETSDTSTWYHIALVRNGDDFDIYQDGVSVANTTDTDSLPNRAVVLTIGDDGNSAQRMEGYIDELRVSKGVAKWSSNFTPPTEEY